uniref:Uncharacterized protein n=1 Tax=Romanomermis culicivorax TaxID=13658 RepID=A0A915JZX7_ROMCU
NPVIIKIVTYTTGNCTFFRRRFGFRIFLLLLLIIIAASAAVSEIAAITRTAATVILVTVIILIVIVVISIAKVGTLEELYSKIFVRKVTINFPKIHLRILKKVDEKFPERFCIQKYSIP